MPDNDTTRAVLRMALADHAAATTDGGMLTDFVLIAAIALPTDADLTTYLIESSDGPPHHRLGLTRRLARRIDAYDAEGEGET